MTVAVREQFELPLIGGWYTTDYRHWSQNPTSNSPDLVVCRKILSISQRLQWVEQPAVSGFDQVYTIRVLFDNYNDPAIDRMQPIDLRQLSDFYRPIVDETQIALLELLIA